jgi:hypothetical protein
MHLDTIEDFLDWLKFYHRDRDCVYKNDGLVACYSKELERQQINVDVWQIFIGGKIISKYQESVKMEECKREDGYTMCWSYPAHMKKICHVGGEKPKSLPGSQDDKIMVEFLP